MPFGLVRGMKTRSGEVVFLEDVLDEARARMLRNMEQSKSTSQTQHVFDTLDQLYVGMFALLGSINNYCFFHQPQRKWKTQKKQQRKWELLLSSSR